MTAPGRSPSARCSSSKSRATMASALVLANQLVGRARHPLCARRDRIAIPNSTSTALSIPSSWLNSLLQPPAPPASRDPYSLFVEGGFLGGRTGCRQLDQAMAVARAVKAASRILSLRGVGRL